jgi:hypothetical protein
MIGSYHVAEFLSVKNDVSRIVNSAWPGMDIPKKFMRKTDRSYECFEVITLTSTRP